MQPPGKPYKATADVYRQIELADKNFSQPIVGGNNNASANGGDSYYLQYQQQMMQRASVGMLSGISPDQISSTSDGGTRHNYKPYTVKDYKQL
jgi:hypothetical protein